MRASVTATAAVATNASLPPAAPPREASAPASPGPTVPAAPAVPEEPRPPDRDARTAFLATLQRPGVGPAAGLRVSRVLRSGLEATARGVAPGMTSSSDPAMASLAEGARLTIPLPMQPGECFTVVAQGGLGVVELDLYLTEGVEPRVQIVAEDREIGPIAVLRGENGCLAGARSAAPDGAVHAVVRQGAGLVAVQIYKR